MSANRIYLFHGPSICTRNNSWPTQIGEHNFVAHPYFLWLSTSYFMCIPYNGPRCSSMFKVFQSESLVIFFSAKCLTVLPKMLITFARSTLKVSVKDTTQSQITSASPLRYENNLTRCYSFDFSCRI